MPARTVNDFFAGLFYGEIKTALEGKMAITRQSDRRKGIRRQGSRRKGDTEKIKIEEARDKKQEEVTVRHETAPEKRATSVWSWYEEFTAKWSETFLTKKRKRDPGRW